MRSNTLLSKPLVIAAALAATTACAWAGLSVYSGRAIERTLNEKYDQLAELPFVKVRERHYDRSLTSATAEVTLAIGWPDRTLPGDTGGKAGFELTLRHRIAHGPFTGGGLAAARVDTELVVPEAIRSRVVALFGERAPIAASTRVSFDGASRSTVEFAPVRFDDAVLATLQRASGASVDPATGARFEWQGMTMTSDLSADQSQVRYEGRFGPLKLEAPDGTRIETSDARFEGGGRRVEGWLFDDDSTMKMQSISMRAPSPGAGEPTEVRMADVVASSSTAVTDGFLGQSQKLQFGRLVVGGKEIGRLDYDTSIGHLHLQTLVDGIKAVLAKRPFECVGLPDEQVEDCLAPAFDEVRPTLVRLLKHEPRFAVDRLALTLPEGEARVDYAVSIGAIDEADLDSPAQLLSRIGVTANASLAEAVIGKFAAMAMAEAGGGAPPSPEALRSMIADGARPLVEQGFLRHADGRLSTSLELRNGMLKINGKPIDPAVTAGAIGTLAQLERGRAQGR
ncbi:MAG: YdgA family protein [Lautropia sp.]